jgi:integrase
MEFKHLNTSTSWVAGDELCVMQIKSQLKSKVLIPLDVGINGWTIRSVIKSCQSNIITRWIIHHGVHHGGAKPGMNVSLGSISRGFAEARDLAGVTGDSETPPTFHEIRSLSIRLYKKKYGGEFAQAIAGHKSAKTSDLYKDTRGAEWVHVKVG